MLRKLFKHEFKETAKLLVPINVALIGLTCLSALLLQSRIFKNESLSAVAFSYMSLYILSIFAVFIITAVYLTIRFYQTMYSNQGYLTHTLPVSTGSIINTKVLVSAFWIFVSMCLTVLCVFTLIRTAAGSEWNFNFATFQAEFADNFGIEFHIFLMYIVFMMILSCFNGILKIFACLSIGQHFLQHRIIASVIAYIVIHIIEQILSGISLLIIGMRSIFDSPLADAATTDISFFYTGIFRSGIIESLIFTILFYVICQYFTNKKLNLE